MGLCKSFMAKNHVFLAIPPSGTHLHLHFDSENHGDGKCGPTIVVEDRG